MILNSTLRANRRDNYEFNILAYTVNIIVF